MNKVPKEKAAVNKSFKKFSQSKLKENPLKWQKTKENAEQNDPYPGPAPVAQKFKDKHSRGDKLDARTLVGRRKAQLYRHREKQTQFAVTQSARAERLLIEDTGAVERQAEVDTASISQREIAAQVDILSAQKHFELRLEKFGPYSLDYTRNGRHLVLGGARGHVAAFDWQTKKLHCEMNVMETVNDVCWLHQETLFAAAQRQWVHVYDNQGVELHCLKQLHATLRLSFLPYHFLLVAANASGYLSFLDVSVGQKVAGYSTARGRLDVMTHNPRSGVTLLGHSGGTVTLWAPTVKEPLATVLCHGSAVRSAAVHPSGNYFATSGIDRKLKLWDMRTWRLLDSYSLSAGAGGLCFSQRGMLAAATGRVVQMYEDPCSKAEARCAAGDTVSDVNVYLSHTLQRAAKQVQFCSYEDVLGVSHEEGFCSLLAPGSAEANIDALEANPYETKQQRRHKEVKMLLDKIPYDVISLESGAVARVDVNAAREAQEDRKKKLMATAREIDFTPRYKKKGRSKSGKAEQRKRGVKQEVRRDNLKQLALLQPQSKAKVKRLEKGVLQRFSRRQTSDE